MLLSVSAKLDGRRRVKQMNSHRISFESVLTIFKY